VLCDGGAKYVSRLFNPAWLEQKRLLEAARRQGVAVIQAPRNALVA
jgi:hypothetical protein